MTDIVLGVDDALQSLGALCSELEAEGHTVLVAFDGAQAIERLDLVTPDAILPDALMPGLDGFESCRRIKAEPAWSHIPVFFMTGLRDTRQIVRGFDAGGVDHVVKPVRAREVLARLATHLRNVRAVRMAQRWLQSFFVGLPASAPMAWLHGSSDTSADLRIANHGDRMLAARRLGSAGLGEVMWLLSVSSASAQAPSRLSTAALTPRETEVLSWVANGKTNRDVAEILGMSPRTANKQLEHVFEKLGVETRAAAAALASRECSAGPV